MIGKRVLLPLAAMGAGYAAFVRPRIRRWGATRDEAAAVYPGDSAIPEADSQSTMATTLPAPPEAVWPWLVQMGCDRAGWYSWDRLDNGGRPSAERIVPEWQDLAAGDRVDSAPSGATYFTVAELDAPRTLVLRSDLEIPTGRPFDPGRPYPRAYTQGVWGFHLTPLPDGRTRLVVRTRGYGRPRPADWIAGFLLGEPAHLIMQLRQFRNLARRVGRTASQGPPGHRAGPEAERAGARQAGRTGSEPG
ncbi:hypothetical protein GCM10023085_20560 [Actinomadura viridis]|uniref:Proline iminopeptidase n=1 Tax=Actinomadura viridis TaxID=58110 RepID=A0A931DJA3_9ACTN|nr:SRPBCC family protein [Actinomadura viridis]MBG6089187.1 proline iminopeptidase [Actinomadura viridis]